MVGCLLRPRALVLQQLRHPTAFAWLSQISFSATKSAAEMAPECRCKNHGQLWIYFYSGDFKMNKLVGAAGFEPTTPTPPALVLKQELFTTEQTENGVRVTKLKRQFSDGSSTDSYESEPIPLNRHC